MRFPQEHVIITIFFFHHLTICGMRIILRTMRIDSRVNGFLTSAKKKKTHTPTIMVDGGDCNRGWWKTARGEEGRLSRIINPMRVAYCHSMISCIYIFPPLPLSSLRISYSISRRIVSSSSLRYANVRNYYYSVLRTSSRILHAMRAIILQCGFASCWSFFFFHSFSPTLILYYKFARRCKCNRHCAVDKRQGRP